MRALAPAALALIVAPIPIMAQGYVGEIRVRGAFIETRGLVRDSLAESDVAGDGLQRTLEDGTRVSCVPGEFCRWFRSGREESIALVTQDLRLSTWPGVRGVAGHVLLRGRYGSDDFWPRTDQELDLVYAYADFERPDFRLRGGRQYRTSPLGYHNFDGGSVLWRGLEPLRVDIYGGWSLARGLDEGRDGDLLEAADERATDERGLLLGVDVSARWQRHLSARATYQREIRSDRLGLYTERVGFSAGGRVGRTSIDVGAKYDLAFGELNDLTVRARSPLPYRTDVAVQLRHYRPFFELWTIWGAFSPVAHDEARLTVGWSAPGASMRVEGGGAYREYEKTDAGVEFVPFEQDGWRAFGRVAWNRSGWFADAAARAERGSGAARYGGDLSIGRAFTSGARITAYATSTQTFSEFRLGEQLLNGAGVRGALPIGELTLVGGYAVYDVSFEGRPGFEDWDQARGHLGVAYRLGSEPGSGGAGATP